MSTSAASTRKPFKAIVPQKRSADGGKRGHGQARAGEEWEVPVWQFVRVMVQLEKNSSGKNTGLWRANADSWAELDQALNDAGEEDFDVFAQLMMNTQVALHLPDGIAKKTLAFTLGSLLLAMRRKLKAQSKRTQERKDLEFEISELDKLYGRVKPPARDDTGAPTRRYRPKRSAGE